MATNNSVIGIKVGVDAGQGLQALANLISKLSELRAKLTDIGNQRLSNIGGTGEGVEAAYKAKDAIASLGSAGTKISETLRRKLPEGAIEAIEAIRNASRNEAKIEIQQAIDVAEKKRAVAETYARNVAEIQRRLQQIQSRTTPGNYTDAEKEAIEGLESALHRNLWKYSQANTEAYKADAFAAKVAQKALAKEANATKGIISTNMKAAEDAVKAAAENMKRALNSLKSAFKNIKSAVSSFGASAKASLRSIQSVFSGAANITRYVSQGLSELFRSLAIPVAGLGYQFVSWFNSAKDFNSAMVRVGKVTQSVDIQWLSNQIRELSKVTTSSQIELAEFAESLGQIGVDNQYAIMRLIYVSEMLTNATDLSAEEVTDNLGQIALAFGWNLNSEQGVRNVENLADVINYLENITAASASQIVTALKNVASVGPLLEIPAEQLAVLSAYMISTGSNADSAGTRLSRWFTNLTTHISNFQSMMSDYTNPETGATPYSTVEDVLKMVNTEPVQVMLDTLDAINRATDDDKANAVAAYFKEFGLVGGKTAALKSARDEIIAALNDINSKAKGSLWAEYNKSLESTEAQLNVLQNNFNEIGVSLGDSFLPTINKIMIYITAVIQELLKLWNTLDDKTKLLVVGIPLITIVLTPVLMVISQIMHGVSLLFMGVVTFLGLLVSIVNTAITLMGTVVNTAISAGKVVIDIGKTLASVGSWVVGLFGAGSAVTAVGGAATSAAAGVGGFGGAIAGAVGSIGGFLSVAWPFLAAIAAIGLAWAGLESAGIDADKIFKDEVIKFGNSLAKTLEELPQKVTDTVASVNAELGKPALEFFKDIGNGVVGQLNGILKTASDAGNKFVDICVGVTNTSTRLANTWIDGIKKTLQGRARTVLTDFAQSIADMFEAHSPPKTGPLSTIDVWGKNLMNTYLGSFSMADFDILSDVGGTIKNILSTMVDFGELGKEDSVNMLRSMRQALAGLITTFNSTGGISDSSIGSIIGGLGEIGPQVGKLIKYWLAYQKIQKNITALEKQRKDVINNNDREIAQILAMNLTAEQKVELMRNANYAKDQEIARIDKEKEAQEEAANAAKEQLDVQRELINALMDEASIGSELRDAISGAAGAADSFDMTVGSLGEAFEQAEESAKNAFNTIERAIASAKDTLAIFWAGFNGEGRSYHGTPTQREDSMPDDKSPYTPGTYIADSKSWDVYNLGVRVREIWDKVKQIFIDIKSVISGGMGVDTFIDTWIPSLKDSIKGFVNEMVSLLSKSPLLVLLLSKLGVTSSSFDGIGAWLYGNDLAALVNSLTGTFGGSGGSTKKTTPKSGIVPKTAARMASGGLATGPTYALIGEGGESEAVLPLSKVPAIFGEVLSASSMNFATNTGPTIVVHMDNVNMRSEKDIDMLAEEITRRIERSASNRARFGRRTNY